jgi:hypothetical protein
VDLALDESFQLRGEGDIHVVIVLR